MEDLKQTLSELGFSKELLEFVDEQKLECYSNDYAAHAYRSFNIHSKGMSEYEISSVDSVSLLK